MPNKDITLYLDGSAPPPVVVVTEADTAWTFRFTVMYQNAIYAPTVANVVLAGHKPDGNAFAFLGSKSGNVFTVGCNVQMTAVPGDVLAALHLLGSGNTAIPFILRVQPAGGGTAPVASASALTAYATILNRIGNFPPNLSQYVTDWLAENVLEGAVVDNTFTIEGAAAPAKLTGDRLKALEEATIETDSTLTVAGAAADAKATGDAIAAYKTAAKSEIIAEITEPSASSAENGNIIDPSNIKKLGYYFDTDGVTHIADTSNRWLVSEDKIPLGDTDIVIYAVSKVARNSRSYEVLCYQDDAYLGKATAIDLSNSTKPQLITLYAHTNCIRLQCNTYGDNIVPSELCVCLDSFDEFIDYGGGADNAVIKASLIDSAAVLADITEKVSDSNNLVDPKNMKAWGYRWASYNGVIGKATYQYQTTRDAIGIGSAVDLYARIRNPLDNNSYSVEVQCWNGDTYLGTAGSFRINTTDEQHMTVKTGTTHVRFTLNIWESTFRTEDICISLIELDDFEEYGYSLKIKQSVLPNDSDSTVIASKRSTLYKKNIIFFGDSLLHNGVVPRYVGQITGANVYNAAVGGTSMSTRGSASASSLYDKWYGMANLADCIATGDWAETLAALQTEVNKGTQNAQKALNDATYMSSLDWDTDVDVIVIAHGANDPATDNAENKTDIKTYAGAARYVIETILAAHPSLRIVFCSVIYRTSGNDATKTKVELLKSVCDEYNIQFIDNYSTLGINALTASTYLADGLHESDKGAVLMYNHIAQELW